MKPLLVPDRSYQSIGEIDFSALTGYKFLIIDVDNTLLGPRETVVSAAVVALLQELRKKKIFHNMCLISNVGFATKKRMARLRAIAQQLQTEYVPAVGLFAKPHKKVFLKALKLMGAEARNTVVIGDQIFTDIRGGNALGMFTILVQPLGRDRWLTRYRRWRERRLKRKEKNL